MVLPATTTTESPETESGRPFKEPQILYTLTLKIGLPEVDKLFAEAQEIIDDETNYMAATRKVDGSKDMEDRISRLPNEILEFIISLLTMREGATTSILSTRWRNLWNASASCLSFDDSNLLENKFPYDMSVDVSDESGGNQLTNWDDYVLFYEGLRTTFISRADQICQTRRASKLEIFQVSFPYYDDSAGHIDGWMEFAASQEVPKLLLYFGCRSRFHSGNKYYKFPVQKFGSSLKYLVLESCIFQFPPNFRGLSLLTSLKLSCSILTDKDVQNVVSNCHSLQLLILMCCMFPDLTVLKFVGPSIRLKHLHIGDCDNLIMIQLHDMNLLSFELIGEEPIYLSVKNVPHLARLVLKVYEPVQILGDIPHLETLFLVHEEGELPKLSALSSLRRLVLSDDCLRSNLFEVVRFVEACPLLQQLELDMRFCISQLDGENDGVLKGTSLEYEGLSSKIGSRPRCFHHNLKEVHIYGFDSHPEIIELAKYLLQCAIVLEKMIMYRNSKSYVGNGSYYVSREFVKVVGMPLEDVLILFQKVARPSTQLLIV